MMKQKKKDYKIFLADLSQQHHGGALVKRDEELMALYSATEEEKEAEEHLHKEIVQREIDFQKFRVREDFRLMKFSVDVDKKQNEAKLGDEVFPNWLTGRGDFQYVFPRFLEYPVDEFSLVAFAMAKETKLRTTYDIDKTVQFMSQFDVFKGIPATLCRTLCKSLRLAEYPADTVLYKVGDASSTFYMILQGFVKLSDESELIETYIGPGGCFGECALSKDLDSVRPFRAITKSTMNSTPPQQQQQQTVNAASNTRRARRDSQSMYFDMSQMIANNNGNNNATSTPTMTNSANTTASVTTGTTESRKNSVPTVNPLNNPATMDDGFGVLKSKPDSIFVLELAAQDFRATKKLFVQTQNSRISKFLRTNVPLFKKWSRHRVNQVAPLLQERSFKPGDVILKTGEDSDELFFVYSGTCSVQREIVKTRTNRWPKTLVKDEETQKMKLEHEVREAKVVKPIQLAELTPGDYFGEEFVIGYKKRRLTVIAQGVTHVLALPKEHVKSMFTNRMIEDMKTNHHALFTSDEAILAKYEREARLKQQYNHLKKSALGTQYGQKVETKSSFAQERAMSRIHSEPQFRRVPLFSSIPAKPLINSHGEMDSSRSLAALPSI